MRRFAIELRLTHMKITLLACTFLCSMAAVSPLFATPPITESTSLTGTFVNTNDKFSTDLLLTDQKEVTFVSYSYAGGTNFDGNSIPGGGFDPIINLFDAAGNHLAMNDDGGESFDFGIFNMLLNPGQYTVVVTRFGNNALGSLADGFSHDGDSPSTDFGGASTNLAFDILIGDPSDPDSPVFFAFHRSVPAVLEVTDFGAIVSANASALPFALAQREIQLDAARAPIRDLNARLFRLRSRTTNREVPAPEVTPMVRDKDGKATVDTSKDAKKVVVVDANTPAPVKTLAVFVGGDFNATDQDALAEAAWYDTETWSGTLGLEYSPTESLTLGLGVSYLSTDSDFGPLGDTETEGFAISPYISFFKDGFYADALYSAGLFQNDFSRKTLLGRTANGDADSFNNTVEIHGGYNLEIGKIVTGPILGGEYVNGTLDGYTETHGGTANVKVDEQNYDSLVSELGWQLSVPIEAGDFKVTPQIRASWKHQFLDEGDTVGVDLAQSPFIRVSNGSSTRHGSYRVEGDTATPAADYASLGAGVSIGKGCWSLILDYEGEFFREDSTSHFASIRTGISF